MDIDNAHLRLRQCYLTMWKEEYLSHFACLFFTLTWSAWLWKTVWQLLTKLNIREPYNPAIVLLGIYPKELKNYVHTKATHRCL